MVTREPIDPLETLAPFLRNLDGALGDRLIGVVLFGSHADNRASEDSDLDLAVIVTDADNERSRREVHRVLGASDVDAGNVSLSVESFMRLQDFLKAGDPFAWVVCSEGRILKDRNDLLAGLQNECRSQSEGTDATLVARYLQSKSYSHYVQAIQALNQFLSNLQLSMMAGAQAVAAQHEKGQLTTEKLVGMADWENLKSALQATTATKREIETVEQLIMAHKHARKSADEFPTKEVTAMIHTAGELWKRLLPPVSAEKGE